MNIANSNSSNNQIIDPELVDTESIVNPAKPKLDQFIRMMQCPICKGRLKHDNIGTGRDRTEKDPVFVGDEHGETFLVCGSSCEERAKAMTFPSCAERHTVDFGAYFTSRECMEYSAQSEIVLAILMQPER